jgi:hypothetical protein
MSTAVGPGPGAPFHHIGPFDFEATLEQYEVLRLRHIYQPKTVYEHKRVLKKMWGLFKEDMLTTNPHALAVRLCRHLRPSQRHRREQEAAAALEAFVRWYQRP